MEDAEKLFHAKACYEREHALWMQNAVVETRFPQIKKRHLTATPSECFYAPLSEHAHVPRDHIQQRYRGGANYIRLGRLVGLLGERIPKGERSELALLNRLRRGRGCGR